MEESEIENIEAVPEIEIEPVEPEEQGSPSMIRCSDIWRRSGNILFSAERRKSGLPSNSKRREISRR